MDRSKNRMPRIEPERGARREEMKKRFLYGFSIRGIIFSVKNFILFEIHQGIVIFLLTDTHSCFITSLGCKPEHQCLTYCKSENHVWKKTAYILTSFLSLLKKRFKSEMVRNRKGFLFCQ